jgi:hypothetical protein
MEPVPKHTHPHSLPNAYLNQQFITKVENAQNPIAKEDNRSHEHAYQETDSQSFLIEISDLLFFLKIRTNNSETSTQILNQVIDKDICDNAAETHLTELFPVVELPYLKARVPIM